MKNYTDLIVPLSNLLQAMETHILNVLDIQ